MKSYRLAALLAAVVTLSLSASFAHAARDETLIQQTRKNQVAHDAQARQEHDKQAATAATAPQQPQRQHG
ncbi:hypothetical protein [Massilia sp. 9096]|uniref:hypothetical protein n=1 Tax=Massilia sp. 9096 TaxID=1500894 RepID=UPI00055E3627|nr:hypothetical protein [Massilia sp. 9096]